MKSDEHLITNAINLARSWQNYANKLHIDFDKEFHLKMKSIMSHPKDKVFLIALLDQAFRSSNNKRIANQIDYLLNKYGLAHFFSNTQKALLWIFQHSTKNIPDVSVPIFINILQDETKHLLINAELLDDFLEKKAHQDITTNINFIGESVLGEKEATKRVEEYIQALGNPNIEYISIKISTIDSQINPLDFENCVERLVHKVALIFRQAKKNCFLNSFNEWEMKFVNFDMEEYKDLRITVEVLKRVLNKEEFKDFRAGVVLQAYLPESYDVLKELTLWAKERLRQGGVPLKVRLVKGANMEMELTTSALKNWPTPTFEKKSQTDAHYKKMLLYALEKQNMEAVHIGIASHNIFELAFAYELAKSKGVLDNISFEMLEGMSESTRVAIKTLTKDIIVYAPVVSTKNFTSAIAYLVRRLDENSSNDNFIKYSFGLEVDSCEWNRQKEFFIHSLQDIEGISNKPKRVQNRLNENFDHFVSSSYDLKTFHNEPDTDFILPNNQIWANNIVKKYKKEANNDVNTIGVVIANGEFIEKRSLKVVYDKSQFPKHIIVGKYAQANESDILTALEVAKNDSDDYSKLSFDAIHKLFKEVAINFRKRRADLIGLSASEVGKTFSQTDTEVSEAIDFVEFYPYAIKKFETLGNIELKEKGVGVIIAPWNFPIAILTGSIAAALSCKNRVIVKPSSASTLCAYAVCQCFWEAGISKNTLQFLPCSGAFANEYLILNKAIDFVILTGSETTAYEILKTNPSLFLTAETGGKNATIVTSLCDADQAIKNVCESAFLNSGQKCSATSLLVLEEELFYNDAFKDKLIDCASSYNVGSVWDFGNHMGPLTNQIGGNLKKALNILEEDEQWALKPKIEPSNEYMLYPCIKWSVKADSFSFQNELFGPLLSVVCAKNIKEAVDFVNSTGYGLTAGLESLDDREIEYFKKSIKAGNVYINRTTTGAIVLRQPFGGLGKSAVGANRKVGTFNYVTQFLTVNEKAFPTMVKEFSNPLFDFINELKKEHNTASEECEKLEWALNSYLQNYQEEFSQEVDSFNLRGEANIFRYIPLNSVVIRITNEDKLFEIFSRVFACKIAHVDFTLSSFCNFEIEMLIEKYQSLLLGKNDRFVLQNDELFGETIGNFDRIIYSNITRVPEEIFKLSVEHNVFIIRNKPFMEGRIELLNYFTEQSISHSYHRYGNISAWSLKKPYGS